MMRLSRVAAAAGAAPVAAAPVAMADAITPTLMNHMPHVIAASMKATAARLMGADERTPHDLKGPL